MKRGTEMSKVSTFFRQLFCSHWASMEQTGREEKRPIMFQVLPTLFLESKCTKCGFTVWLPAQQTREMYWDAKIAQATVEVADAYAKQGDFKMATGILKGKYLSSDEKNSSK